jgi:predicted  nucleic acid-binding Zn-ribbon protein
MEARMTTVEALQIEFGDLKRRQDLTEINVKQMQGQFEAVSGQLRDSRLYMHAKHADIDTRIDHVDGRLGSVDEVIEALPRVMAELEVRSHARFDAMNAIFASIDAKFTAMGCKIDALASTPATRMALR